MKHIIDKNETLGFSISRDLAFSSGHRENKRLIVDVNALGVSYRVINRGDMTWEGFNLSEAVDAYNAL
jgi:hypothetical protein